MSASERAAADELDVAVDGLRRSGIERVHVLAWRDLDDAEAGGSEIHADHLMRRWADRGLDVHQRTSQAAGFAAEARRNGYGVVRRGGRHSVFPRAVAAELSGRMGRSDALVEIWNGVPWFSPLWYRRPHITVVHHVHREMWDQSVPRVIAPIGRATETRLGPMVYRRGLTVTPSEATRDELLELGYRPDRVLAVPNGVDEVYRPGGHKSDHPSLVAVARLAPVKRFDALIDAAIVARERLATLTLTIVGDGPLRADLEALVRRRGVGHWVTLTGRLDRDQIVPLYQRAWLVVSASLAEGWGLSLTEGAACGTPSVATDIRGHRSSVVDGTTGVLAPLDRLGDTIADVLLDDRRRSRLAEAALARARTFTWDATALGFTRALLSEVPVAAGARR